MKEKRSSNQFPAQPKKEPTFGSKCQKNKSVMTLTFSIHEAVEKAPDLIALGSLEHIAPRL
jgi:hypothetical protein